MNLFNNQQKLNLEVKLRYVTASYDYLNNNHKDTKKKFLFILKDSLVNLKFMSQLKIILIKLKTIWFKKR
tara:strand:+ start:104 stop:313 length:210 start_codon:yes stop_codon:yes gene_type:complete